MASGRAELGVTGFPTPFLCHSRPLPSVIPDLIGDPEEIWPYVLLDSRFRGNDEEKSTGMTKNIRTIQ